MLVPDARPVTVDPPALAGRRVLRQRWADLAYLHWRYPLEEVQRLLPAGVRVDVFDDSAWVGLIPFVMRDVRVGPTPPIPYLGTFVEVNVRTYVIDTVGRRAVWFFSLDVPRAVIVAVARSAFALRYCWSPGAAHTRLDSGRHRFEMRRRWPRGGGAARIEFTVGEEMAEPDDLAHFLSARWGLLTTRRRSVLHGAVAHPRWPLHGLDELHVEQDVIEAAGLSMPRGEPHAMWSPGVDVEVGWLQRVGA